jgi:GntR family transcriptional repressor for pyruvate dehydrogenase complex
MAALPGASAQKGHQPQSLVVQVRDAIRAQIAGGQFRPGDRLPSEARLTQDFGVSRTVVREAIAALQSDRLVEPRQGAGVFVLTPPAPDELAFQNVDLARVASLIEMLELRTAVEGDAAGFAALRRSPAQEENIIEAFEVFRHRALEGLPTTDADYAFHTSIAEAANNPRFAEFLRLTGKALIPRSAVGDGADAQISPDYARRLIEEHEAVVVAIQNGDETAARTAMRSHLHNSQTRYRQYLRGVRR